MGTPRLLVQFLQLVLPCLVRMTRMLAWKIICIAGLAALILGDPASSGAEDDNSDLWNKDASTDVNPRTASYPVPCTDKDTIRPHAYKIIKLAFDGYGTRLKRKDAIRQMYELAGFTIRFIILLPSSGGWSYRYHNIGSYNDCVSYIDDDIIVFYDS